jgi:hypothetical protein
MIQQTTIYQTHSVQGQTAKYIGLSVFFQVYYSCVALLYRAAEILYVSPRKLRKCQSGS